MQRFLAAYVRCLDNLALQQACTVLDRSLALCASAKVLTCRLSLPAVLRDAAPRQSCLARIQITHLRTYVAAGLLLGPGWRAETQRRMSKRKGRDKCNSTIVRLALIFP